MFVCVKASPVVPSFDPAAFCRKDRTPTKTPAKQLSILASLGGE
jgi:hypothetical protein